MLLMLLSAHSELGEKNGQQDSGEGIRNKQCDQIGRFIGLWATF